MEILILLVAIILIVIAFFVGRKFASSPIDTSKQREYEEVQQKYEKVKQEYNELNNRKEKLREQEKELELRLKDLYSDAKWMEENVRAAEVRQSELQAQYEEKLKVIENTKQIAEDAANERRKVLEATYEKDRIELENQRRKILEEIDNTRFELQSLQNTKIAVMEAARKEKEIKANKDFFTLSIPKAEQRDVEILEETRMRISKPRALSMVIWTAYYQQVAKRKFPKILGKQDVCGIYKITNLQTEECYIGQAKDVRLRWYDHIKAAIGIDTPTGNKLYPAMQEYGIENFSFELLEECPPQDLDKKEKYFISLYNSNSLGYNGNKGIG